MKKYGNGDKIEQSFPEWRGEFISYKQLKRQLNLTDPKRRPYKNRRITSPDILDQFILLLNHELDKVNRFYLDKEEDYIIRLKVLFISLFFSVREIVVFVQWYIDMQFAGTTN